MFGRNRVHGGLLLVVRRLFVVVMIALVVLPTSTIAAEKGDSTGNKVVSAEKGDSGGDKIFGGQQAVSGQFRFFAQYKPSLPNNFCGGVYIHEDIVLGAAQCGLPETCSVILNSIDFLEGPETLVESYTYHPDRNSSLYTHNFVIMKLNSSTVPSEAIPIAYNTNPLSPFTNQELTVLGFGSASQTPEGSPTNFFDKLNHVQVNFVPYSECSSLLNGSIATTAEHDLCATAPRKGFCDGDEGGPLFTNGGVTVGLVSGKRDCTGALPQVYSRIDTSSEWIGNAICCLSDFKPASCSSTTVDCSAMSIGNVTACRPPNDECEGAFPILEPGQITFGSTASATAEVLNDDCSNIQQGAGLVGVWYSVLGDGSLFRLSTCSNRTDYDTFISVYTGTCGDLVCAAANDDAESSCSSSTKSILQWESEVNTTYYILVQGYEDSIGNFELIFEKSVVNDECINAIDITNATAEIILGSTVGATAELLTDDCSSFASNASLVGVWYKIMGDSSTFRLSTCNPNTDFDTFLSVYTSNSNTCGNLTCAAANDDAAEGVCPLSSRASFLEWVSEPNTMYYVLVHGYGTSNNTGNFGLLFEKNGLNPDPGTPPNDECINAIEITTPNQIILGSTANATAESLTDDCSSIVPEAGLVGVWYTLMGDGSTFRLSTCTADTLYDTFLGVYTSTGNNPCGSLTCAAANDDAESGTCPIYEQASILEWVSDPDTVYYVLVQGWQNRTGDFGLLFQTMNVDPDDVNASALMILQRLIDLLTNMLAFIPDLVNALMIVLNNN